MTPTPLDRLHRLATFPIPVYVSRGYEERGSQIADLACNALSWLAEVTGESRQPTLVIAGPDDWPHVCEMPLYGMPFSIPDKLGTSPDPATWWDEFYATVRPVVPGALGARMDATYGAPADFTALADLIITHEATHLFHQIDPVTMASEFPADWLMELFANIGMYGFVATHHPERLPLLATLAEATIAAGPAGRPLTALAHMGDSMQSNTANYVWYEFLLIALAERLWNSGGADAMVTFRRHLGHPALSESEVIDRLAEIEPEVATLVRAWPRLTPHRS